MNGHRPPLLHPTNDHPLSVLFSSTCALLVLTRVRDRNALNSFCFRRLRTTFIATEGWTPHHLSSGWGRVRTLPAGCPVRCGIRGDGVELAMATRSVEQCSRPQHGAQHGQQSIGYAAQRSPMRMSASAQLAVVLVADGILLHAH